MEWRFLLIGFLAGFILEWIVDAFLRARLRREHAVPPLVSDSERAVDPSQPLALFSSDTAHAKVIEENAALRHALAAVKQERDELRQGVIAGQWRLDQAIKEIHDTRSTKVVNIAKDIFERIEGIGPVYQERLWNAGILKYSELAATSEERLREIIHPQDWQNLDFLYWRRAAARLATEALEGGGA